MEFCVYNKRTLRWFSTGLILYIYIIDVNVHNIQKKKHLSHLYNVYIYIFTYTQLLLYVESTYLTEQRSILRIPLSTRKHTHTFNILYCPDRKNVQIRIKFGTETAVLYRVDYRVLSFLCVTQFFEKPSFII